MLTFLFSQFDKKQSYTVEEINVVPEEWSNLFLEYLHNTHNS